MKIKAILFGRSRNLIAQAEQLFGFIHVNLESKGVRCSTILLATKDVDPDLLLRQAPTKKVELVRVSDYQAETILKVLQAYEAPEDTDLYLFPSGALADDIAVRWAYRINGSALVQVKSIDCLKTEMRANKSVYTNHVRASFRMLKKPYCISLAKDGGVSKSVPRREKATVVEHDLSDVQVNRPFVAEWIPEEAASDLECARFLVVGGRGLGSESDCQELEKKAHALGAEFGVSRPVAMSAWAPLHCLIGVSGAIAKPEVCIAAAVSGAAAFYAGIAHSKKIIAINIDDRAPITKAADVVIIDDYKAIMQALVEIILKTKE